MDDIKKEFKQFRGCFVVLGVILVLAVGGGIGMLAEPLLGNLSGLASLGGMLIAILVWIGLAKGARWAKITAGVLLSIIGVGVALFILFDFATSLIKGHGLFSGSAGSAYGQTVFIILFVGIAMLGGGLYLIGWLK